jgi:hypothetical protein
MKSKRTILQIMFAISVILIVGYQKAYSLRNRISTWDLTFKGTASGGSLVLAKNQNRTVKYVSIQTSPGESAESVTRRLANTINWHISRDTDVVQYDQNILWVGGYQVSASGNTLRLPLGPSDYILAGTESGFGIPKPPVSLSCSYDEAKDKVMLRWINPHGGYDFIFVKCYWTDFDNTYTELLIGSATSFTIDRKRVPVNIDDMDFRVIGLLDNIPSNTAAIHVNSHGYCQTETYGIPFTDGIAPNWKAWSTVEEIDKDSLKQQVKYPDMLSYNSARALLVKPFYQDIKAQPANGMHGVYRKFLGLTPGNTYRLTACMMTTLEMDSIEGNWSLSLCAAPSAPDGKDLTVQQLAGLAALPDKRSGLEAGRIASYGPGNTTKGVFELTFSDENDSDASQSCNITLPDGVDTITVWVRFSCEDPNGIVGFSGVKLEDITAISNPKSPEQIKHEENQHEERLLRWIEKKLSEESHTEPQPE